MTPAGLLGISDHIWQFFTDATQTLTIVIVIATVAILGRAVHRLSHAVHLLASARMTDSLARQSTAETREWGS